MKQDRFVFPQLKMDSANNTSTSTTNNNNNGIIRRRRKLDRNGPAIYNNRQNRLVPLPTTKSRKRARQVTTLFHRYTKLRENTSSTEKLQQIDKLIDDIGGRMEYQRASQISTSYHSTSKWVLGHLARNGWLYGIKEMDEYDQHETTTVTRSRQKCVRRETRVLEIGAINTELLDAAAAYTVNPKSTTEPSIPKMKYRLHVRAIDLHSVNDRIEEMDFLSMPLLPAYSDHNDNHIELYDVIVCSMVLNCVPTPIQRGDMLWRMKHFVRPGGLVFITIPNTCLNLSPYIDQGHFKKLLQYVGLNPLEDHTKESPKISFFVCQSSAGKGDITYHDPKWLQIYKIREGKRYKNDFAIMLTKQFPTT